MVESIYFLKPAWCGTHFAGLWPEQGFQPVTRATALRRWFVTHDLDEDQTSPLRSRILRYPKEKDKWIKTNQLLPVVKGLLLPGGALHEKNHAERKRILIAYLEAVSKVFPEAWADQKGATYALIQTSSLQIVFSLLPDIMQRCDFYEGFNYNVGTFERQLGPLVDTALLSGWKRSAVEIPISTQSKRAMFLGQLKEALKLKAPPLSKE